MLELKKESIQGSIAERWDALEDTSSVSRNVI